MRAWDLTCITVLAIHSFINCRAALMHVVQDDLNYSERTEQQEVKATFFYMSASTLSPHVT